MFGWNVLTVINYVTSYDFIQINGSVCREHENVNKPMEVIHVWV